MTRAGQEADLAVTPQGPTGSRLSDLRSFRDAELGIEERFLTPTLGGGRTVAVLSLPIGPSPTRGWVMCHSYGLEQITLAPLEVPVARSLAAAGAAVLRFQVQGYGDSEMSQDDVGLDTHLTCSADAAALLLAESGVSTVGFFGSRLGGAVAAMTAERLAADGVSVSSLILWDPTVRGRAYVQGLLRLAAISELLSKGRKTGSAREPLEVLRETGVLDVQGYPLRSDAFDAVAALDLLEQVRTFRGRSLVVQISKGQRVRPDLQRLVEHLRGLGGDTHLETVATPQADRMGRNRYKGVKTGEKADTQADLAEHLISATLRWSASDQTREPT